VYPAYRVHCHLEPRHACMEIGHEIACRKSPEVCQGQKKEVRVPFQTLRQIVLRHRMSL
jgi:hypothetical protein